MPMKQTGRKVYKTMQGKQIDMDLLRQRNELTPAVGNAKVNARGDELGAGGKIVRKKEEVLKDYYAAGKGVVDEQAVKKGGQSTAPTAEELAEWEEDEEGNFVKKIMLRDYQTYDLKVVAENQDIFVNQCNQLYEIVQGLGIEDSTWQYKEYNIFSLSSSSEAFWFLWKNIQVCIRKYIGDDRPAWMTGWLNYHKHDEVLDWHNHLGSQYHGYVSIDPKLTKLFFKTDDDNYEIQNVPGLLYLGPSARLHKVEALEHFDGHRITIAFDATTDKDVFSAKEKEYNWIPVY